VHQYQGTRSGSWRVVEPYVRVGGKSKKLFQAVDKHGQLIDFMLSDRRNTREAYRFLRKALKTMSDYPPSSITPTNWHRTRRPSVAYKVRDCRRRIPSTAPQNISMSSKRIIWPVGSRA
jgi:IS6 family transposase